MSGFDNLGTTNHTQSSVRLYLESERGESLGGSDVHKRFYLQHKIEADPGNRIIVQLLDAEFAISFYPVNSSNNYIEWTTVGVPGFRSYTIPIGNYTATQMATVLSTEMTLQESAVVPGVNVVVTYNSTLMKFKFSYNLLPLPNSFQIMGTSTTERLLGFIVDQDYPVPAATAFITPALLDMTGGYNNVFVKCSNLDLTNLNSEGRQDGILGKISLAVPFSAFNVYVNPNYGRNIIAQQVVEYIDVELQDVDNKPLGGNTGLNNMPWSLTIVFFFINDIQFQQSLKQRDEVRIEDPKAFPKTKKKKKKKKVPIDNNNK